MYRRISIFDFDGTIIVNKQENVPEGWRDEHGKIIFNSTLSPERVEDLVSDVRRKKGEEQEQSKKVLFDSNRDKSLSFESFARILSIYMYPGAIWMTDPGSVEGVASQDVVDALHQRIGDPQTYVMLVTARSQGSEEIVLDRLAEPDIGVSYDSFDEIRFKEGFGSTSDYKRRVARETVEKLDNAGELVSLDELLVEVFEDLSENIQAIQQELETDGIAVEGNPGVTILDTTEKKEARKKEVSAINREKKRRKPVSESLRSFILEFLSQ